MVAGCIFGSANSRPYRPPSDQTLQRTTSPRLLAPQSRDAVLREGEHVDDEIDEDVAVVSTVTTAVPPRRSDISPDRSHPTPSVRPRIRMNP